MPSLTDLIDDCHNRVYPDNHPWGSGGSNSKTTNSSSGKKSSGKKK